jgi:hypothetical protein
MGGRRGGGGSSVGGNQQLPTSDKTPDGSPGSAVSNTTMQQPSTFSYRRPRIAFQSKEINHLSEKPVLWIRIWDPDFFSDTGSPTIFLRASQQFKIFWVKSTIILCQLAQIFFEGKTMNFFSSSFLAAIGSGIWDSRSGMDKNRIQDKHPGSVTLRETRLVLKPSARI